MKTIYFNHSSKECKFTYFKPCVMALGFFDGIHIGHRKLIDEAREISRHNDLELAVMTFFPHPKEVLKGGKFPYLMSLEKKIETLEGLGVEKLFVVRFDEEFAKLAPEEFVRQYLLSLKAKEIVTGFDFTYGRYGAGNVDTIEAHSKGQCRINIVGKVEKEGEKISSSLIRKLLQTGQVDKIPEFLGSEYQSKCTVLSKENRQNLIKLHMTAVAYHSMPCSGAYEIEVRLNDSNFHAIGHVFAREDGKVVSEVWIPLDHMPIDCNLANIKWLKRLSNNEEKMIRVG